jgi:hypothetical protein
MIYGFAPMTITKRCGLFGGKAGTGLVERCVSMRKSAIASASTLRSSPTLRSTPLKYWSIRIVLFASVIGIPALTMASLISLAKSAASWPPEPVHSSSIIVGANDFNDDLSISFCSTVSRRPAILAVTAAVLCTAFAANCRASARCASASAACFLADTMSFSKESASVRAPRARFNAWDEAACAPLASLSAFPSESSALPAFFRASFAWDNAVEEFVTALSALSFASFSLGAAIVPGCQVVSAIGVYTHVSNASSATK